MSDTATEAGTTLFPFDAEPWVEQHDKLRGKRLITGTGGFHLQHVEMAPGNVVTPHHHSMNELIVIIKGGCSFGDERVSLGAGDSMVLVAGHDYGFVVGDEGMTFLIVRPGAATNSRLQDTSTSKEPEKETERTSA